MTDATFTAIIRLLPNGNPITLKGRLAWALLQMVDAGAAGCTPLDNPGPRWSGYVHRLRTDYGISIETVTESHSGPFAGHHAKYLLRSEVEVLDRSACPQGSVAA